VSFSTLVSLGLRGDRSRPQPNQETEAAIFRRLLSEAFEILANAIEPGQELPPDVSATVIDCRAGIASGLPADGVGPLADLCFTSVRRFTSHARGTATAQRAQVTALVAMVRDTVATIAGSQLTLDDTLAGSADRVDRIAQLDNLQDIQAHLIEEVEGLRRLVIERRASWEQTLQEFGQRLTGLEEQLDTTRREATIDPLTNVSNRRVFERLCQTWMEPNHPPFVLVVADVDDFKAINDLHGHAVGDQVLVAVASTLALSLRPGDLVARLGGDEFAVLAAPLTLQRAQSRFADIVRAIGIACRPLVGSSPTPSISVGIAEYSAGDTRESLQERADQALYEAKRSGKGRVVAKARPLIRDLAKGHRLLATGR
jgi:diguanylate cyclase (GGDEF)-like protein